MSLSMEREKNDKKMNRFGVLFDIREIRKK